MSERIIEQLVKKLGLQNESRILSKTTELLRLLDIKSSQLSFNIGDYGKIVILIDLAAASLGIPLENIEDVLKISGLRQNAYQNHKRTFEKILDINKVITINDICIQLGLNEVAQKAKALLEIYKQSIGDKENNVDIAHPQYVAMAVYQACKLGKIKVPRINLIRYSHLKTSQWGRLEEQWKIILEKNDLEKLVTKKQKNNDAISQTANETQKNCIENSTKSIEIDEVEDYESWKARMLTKALKMILESKCVDTTNFVLPSVEEIRKFLSPNKHSGNIQPESSYNQN